MGIDFTWSSIMTTTLFFSLFIVLLSFALKWKNEELNRNEVLIAIICCTLILVRGIFPFEILKGKSIYITVLYPDICQWIRAGYVGKVTVGIVLSEIYIAGIIITAAIKIFRYLRFQRFISQGKVVGSIKAEKKWGGYAEIPIVVIKEIQDCFITGLVKPKLVMADEKQECSLILQHELEHYRNHDLWKKLAIEIVCIIYWWNPFNTYLRKYASNLMELKTDFGVLHNAEPEQKIAYAELLSGIKNINTGRSYGLGIAQSAEFTKVRVRSLLNRKTYGKVKKRFWILLVMVVISFFIVFEPSSPPDDDTFDIESEDFRLIEEDGKYVIYWEGECLGPLDGLPKELENKVEKGEQEK